MLAAPSLENVQEKWIHSWELIFVSLGEQEKHVTSSVCSPVAVAQDKNLKSTKLNSNLEKYMLNIRMEKGLGYM